MTYKLSISDRIFYGFTALCIPGVLISSATIGSTLSNTLLYIMGAGWVVIFSVMAWNLGRMAITGKGS